MAERLVLKQPLREVANAFLSTLTRYRLPSLDHSSVPLLKMKDQEQHLYPTSMRINAAYGAILAEMLKPIQTYKELRLF